jgi:hypothetical protein
MNIILDLHGTIDNNPEAFKYLTGGWIQAGHNVYVLSGPTRERIEKELDNLNLEKNKHYTDIYSVVDFLQQNNTPMYQDEKQRWWACEDFDWWESKAKICSTLPFKIDIMIDNDIRYCHLNNFPFLKFHSPQTIFFLYNNGRMDFILGV